MNLVNHKMFNCVGVQKPLVEYALVELFCSIVAVQYILVQATWKGTVQSKWGAEQISARHEAQDYFAQSGW